MGFSVVSFGVWKVDFYTQDEMSTDYHAKYFAYDLTRQGGKGIDRLSRSLFDACVDLNPHQVEAAIFAIE